MSEKKAATVRDYIRIARPDHWIKNLFILPGFFVAMVLVKDLSWQHVLDWHVLIALISTSCIASANYVINEWLDAKFDKFHPVKKNRPVVVADLKLGYVLLEYAVLAILGMALSLMINRLFMLMALWLLAMGIVYNVEPLRTKDVPFLDVLSESVNNMIRLLMGWFVLPATATTIPPCSIILGYWMCGAFLMAAKRFAEYRMIGDPERAGLYRKSFRRYTEASLLVSALCYALVATFLIGIFMVKYKIELILSVPFLMALFGKYIAIAYKEDSAAQKPEKLYKEEGLMILTLVFIISIVIGSIVKLPGLSVFTSTDFISLPGPAAAAAEPQPGLVNEAADKGQNDGDKQVLVAKPDSEPGVDVGKEIIKNDAEPAADALQPESGK